MRAYYVHLYEKKTEISIGLLQSGLLNDIGKKYDVVICKYLLDL